MQPPSPARRPVRCQEHGIFYDPSRADGCALCGSSKTVEAAPRRFSPLGIATAAAAVALVSFGIGKALRALADSGEQIMAEAAEGAGKLAPERYRAEIETLEAAVYGGAADPFAYPSRVLRGAVALGEAIRGDAENGPALHRARLVRFSQEVLSFGQRTAASADVGYAAPDPGATAREWEEVRGLVFLDAGWPGGDGAAREVGASRPAMATSTVVVLRHLHAELNRLSRFGRSEALRLGEPDAVPGSAEARRLIGEWQDFRQTWGGRLRLVLDRVPAGGRWLDANGQSAHQNLRWAAENLLSVVQPSSLPSRTQRRQYFDQADRYLTSAQRHLAQIAR